MRGVETRAGIRSCRWLDGGHRDRCVRRMHSRTGCNPWCLRPCWLHGRPARWIRLRQRRGRRELAGAHRGHADRIGGSARIGCGKCHGRSHGRSSSDRLRSSVRGRSRRGRRHRRGARDAASRPSRSRRCRLRPAAWHGLVATTRVGCDARVADRKERRGVHVTLVLVGVTNAQLDVGTARLGIAARADRPDIVPLGDRDALRHRDGAELSQRHRPAIGRENGYGLAAARNRPRECDCPCGRGDHCLSRVAADIDSPMLTSGVGRGWVERERHEDRPACRPRPCSRGCGEHESNGNDDQEPAHGITLSLPGRRGRRPALLTDGTVTSPIAQSRSSGISD